MPREVVDTVFDVVRWDEHDRGGHFPALERTDVLAASVRRFAAS